MAGCCHTLPCEGQRSCFTYCKQTERGGASGGGVCPKRVTAKWHLVGGKSERTVEGGQGRGLSLGDQ